jgi:hypothetical protein
MDDIKKTPSEVKEYIAPTLVPKSKASKRASKRAEKEWMKAIKKEIKQNPNKEPFDYSRFTELYWRKDAQGDVSADDPPHIQEEYRRRYYLDFVDVQTMAEFAEELETLDAQAGN